jgi:hypothetical protein
MSFIFTANYFFVGCDVSIDSGVLLMTDFVNLKMKSTQFFRDARRSRMCIYVFIGVNTRTCINICVYTMFLKKTLRISMNVARYKYWQSASLMARRREAAGFTSLLH